MFYAQYSNKLYLTTAVLGNKNSYLQASHSKIENKNHFKEAGIDVGTNNIAAIFINDETTPSLIVDGRKYKNYNFKFNQLIAGLNKNKMIQCAKKRKKIEKIISSLYEKRDKYLKDQFFKIAKRITEYLYLNGVSTIYISGNPAGLKNMWGNNSDKTIPHSDQIYFFKFLRYIKCHAQDYGIQVHYIDERFTSKTSCISDDIKNIQINHNLTNTFNGKRVTRGLFMDTTINKTFHADINAAVNHIKVATGEDFSWLKNRLFKLASPIKIKSNQEFCKLIKSLQNSTQSDKKAIFC